ncbi:MAG: protein-L-isoaspartate O-methyltransferase [Magnetococcales bacterium]|nr:protein-L-isoaspartate O-methyltransferase [Magnetococcales bacterium]MBF0583282.1 protein-L-isoaspartate O-methyltransferase [Magnetococcales bacterium]
MKKFLHLCVALLLLAGITPTALCFGEVTPFDVATLPTPDTKSKNSFIESMGPGKDRAMLALRYDRLQAVKHNKDLTEDKEAKAFLLTARESFVLPRNLPRAYDHAFLDIGYGVTISGPHLVMRMTSALDVQPEDKVLEVGTGSGYQSAILAHLSNHVYSVEIIEPLHERTKGLYKKLVEAGDLEYQNVHLKSGDGYYGWEENGPFNKIIVTCAIDHIPPSLLKQLAPNGVMVIPVGPPGKQTLLKVQKEVDAEGKVVISRKDVYNGRRSVSFVPFTKEKGGTWSGKGNH